MEIHVSTDDIKNYLGRKLTRDELDRVCDQDLSESKSIRVELQASSCVGSDFILSSYSSVRGRVFGVNGEALSRVCLDLMPADKAPNRYFRIFDCTKEDGHYKLEEIPPGKIPHSYQ